MRKLYTIGYEGADLSAFVATLKAAKTSTLLDVRELPISRRKGFSKNALKDALAEVGIDYRHERQLGSPRDMRHRLRDDWNYKRFFKDFDKHLNQQSELIEQLADELRGNVALMCFEKDHSQCHRTPVVDALAKLVNKTPVHLGVDNDKWQTQQAAHLDISQGVSAA
ncbi:MAG: DUF488 domain-containing protein [Arenicellales bacterium]